MTESALIRAILVAASHHGARLFRNNVGQLQDIEGRWVRYGVCNPGGSDLIGWTATGQFLAVEVKAVRIQSASSPMSRTVTTDDQTRFLAAVRKAGGIGIIARSVDDVISAIEKPREATHGVFR